VTGQLVGARASIFGSDPSLLTIIALILLLISGALERLLAEVFTPAPARPSTIRLGAPSLVAMSPSEAADAARLLGSSVAVLAATDWDNS